MAPTGPMEASPTSTRPRLHVPTTTDLNTGTPEILRSPATLRAAGSIGSAAPAGRTGAPGTDEAPDHPPPSTARNPAAPGLSACPEERLRHLGSPFGEGGWMIRFAPDPRLLHQPG